MKYQAIIEVITKNVYKCPKCPFRDEHEVRINEHLISHEYHDLRDECGAWGNNAMFESEAQARRYIELHQGQINTRYMGWGDITHVKLEWNGSGAYYCTESKEIKCNQDGDKTFEITFYKKNF